MVTIRPDVAPGDTGPIEIGGSFTGSIDFQRPSLTARQVLIGLNGPGEVWTGGVSYSGVTTPFTLAPGAPDPLDTAPYYKRSSADLGGGAVGLVPFHFHQGVDCVPETDSLLNIAPEEVILEYYGPIAETNAASGVPPFIVERAREGAAQAA